MTNKIPSGTRKHHQSTKPGVRKRAKCISFFFFFLSSFFRQASSILYNLSWWFTHETAAFLQSSAQPHRLFTKVLQGARNHSLKNYGFQFGMPFFQFHLYTCTLEHHLHVVMTRNHYSRSLN